jgi:hypothetical protein
MQKRRWPWLLGAVLLVGLAALLMRVGEDENRPRSVWDKVEIPRRATAEDKQRQTQRQVLQPVAPAFVPLDAGVAQAPPPPPRPRDPVLAALGGDFKKGAFVLEANAVRNSPIGQLLVDCITSRDDGEGLRRFTERTGVDPLTQLDRVAISDDMVVFSGDFKGLKFNDLKAGQQFGESAQLYNMPRRDGGEGRTLGTWGGQLVAIGESEEQVKQTLERIEGKRPMESGGLTDSQAYGEIYGVLSPEQLQEMIAEENPKLAEKVGSVAQRVELHVDTSGDIGIAARIEGTDAAETKEVSKALGAAMSLARLKAQADGETEMAELLDMGRVVTDGSNFRIEAAVPQVWMEKMLKKCVERNKARRERDKADAEAPPEPVEAPQGETPP